MQEKGQTKVASRYTARSRIKPAAFHPEMELVTIEIDDDQALVLFEFLQREINDRFGRSAPVGARCQFAGELDLAGASSFSTVNASTAVVGQQE